MTLDPKDWPAFRASAHKMLDASIDRLMQAREGRVWTPLPDDMTNALNEPLPQHGVSTGAIAQQLEGFLPYGVGNTHPRFFGWVHGAGAPSGLLPDIAAGAMNVNAGGRNHIAPVIERQVVAWAAEMTGMPASSSGLVLSGTSMATIVALKTARDQHKFKHGLPRSDFSKMTGYTSAQTHSCIARAFDMLGMGVDNLRKIPCNDQFQVDCAALRAAIVKDRAAGLDPFVIIGTAGAVNMGAIDDLAHLAEIASAEGVWLHVDGAFGATAIISKTAKQQLAGLGLADSLAFDFHKWLQVNYDAGCVLIKDSAAHRRSFTDRPEYLRGQERGLAGGAFWAVDYGPELSRGFRALKVWAHIKEHGIDALAAVIDRNIAQARYLEGLIKASKSLEMLAPVPLNICCFRHKYPRDIADKRNQEIVFQLQESGVAVPSTTIIDGKLAIRVNLTNHRTTTDDLDLLVRTIEEIGAGL